MRKLRFVPTMRRLGVVFFFSSRRRHTRFDCDWSSDVCSSDLTYPNPLGLSQLGGVNGILNPTRGQPTDWAMFRPNTLFGQFQPHMRSQYSAQYNLTIQRQLTNDMKLEVGYVGSQGHRLLATHDIN